MTSTIETLKQNKQALVDELIKAGAKFKGNSCNCPYHNDKKPSAGIFQNNKGQWRFKCHGCGVSGSVLDIKARNEGKPVSEILKGVRNNSGVKQSKPVTKIFKTIDELKAVCPGNVEAVYKYKNPKTQTPDMIVIRCQTESGKTFRQCRPCSGGFEMKAPEKPWPIYNRGLIAEAKTVVVVEGEKCAHALHQYGIIATTSPAGAGKAEYADWQLLAGKKIIIWPDNDKKGFTHSKDVEDILLKLGCKVYMVNPANLDLQAKEDAYDFIAQFKTLGYSNEEIKVETQKALNSAEPIRTSGGLLKLIEDTESGLRESISLQFTKLSKLSQPLLPGTLLLLCGTPGSGKSFFVMQLLLYWLRTNVKFACYMLEEDKEYHLHRALAMLESNAQIFDPDWLKANASQVKEAYRRQADTLDKFGACLWSEPEQQLNYVDLANWAEDRAKEGCRVIAIDPVTAAEQNKEPWVADTKFLMKLKKIGTDYGVSIVIVTHPKKGKTAPGMDDLAGGAAFQRFAQCIYWLEFHKEPKEVNIKTDMGTIEMEVNRTIHICKSRNGRGHGFALGFNFSGDSLLFREKGIIVK